MKKPELPISILYDTLVNTRLPEVRESLLIENLDKIEAQHKYNVAGISSIDLNIWKSRNETNTYINDHYHAIMMFFRDKHYGNR